MTTEEKTTTGGVDPELAAAAAAQMRRPAPGQEPKAKRQKKEGEGDDSKADDLAPVLGRFAYDAPQRLAQGTTSIMLTCNMRNEKTSAKEVLKVLPSYLEQAAKDMATTSDNGSATDSTTPAFQFSITKVGVQGIVVLLVSPSAATTTAPGDSSAGAAAAAGDGDKEKSGAAATAGTTLPSFVLTAAVNRLTADIETHKHKKFSVTQRIYPFETTCVFEPEALKKHIQQLAEAFAKSPLAKELQAQHEAGKTIKLAGAFKNRNSSKNVPTWNGKDLLGTDPHPYTLDPPATTATNGGAAGSGQQQQDAGSTQGSSAAEGDPEAAFIALAPKTDKGPANPAAALRSSVLNILATSASGGLSPWTTAVDLSNPDLLVFCEVIPAGGKMYAGLALVPASMGKTKPNIALKSLHA